MYRLPAKLRRNIIRVTTSIVLITIAIIAIIIGCGVTMLVQSSSITTSTLTPLVGLGVVQLEQMFPLTLGANIGTMFTGLLAAMVSGSIDSIQVALCHLLFNIAGIIIWYPLPVMRRVPLMLARMLGKATRIWKFFPIVYIFFVFFVVEIFLLLISELFVKQTLGYTALGIILTGGIVSYLLYVVFWWRYRDGAKVVLEYMTLRQRKADALESLPDNMEFLLEELARVKASIGLQDKIEETEEVQLRTIKRHGSFSTMIVNHEI